MILQNKNALITGGSSGFGLALAKLLIAKGCTVYITGRNENKLKNAALQIASEKLQTLVCDVADYQTMQQLLEDIKEIDVLINNAAGFLEGSVSDYSFNEISQIIDSNLKGTIYTTKLVLPSMLAKGEGFIVNVSSSVGLEGRPHLSVYAATKFAVRGFTESLQLDLAATNIKVAGFYPGGMKTDLYRNMEYKDKLDDWMDPEKVAEVVLFMLERDDSMIVDHVEVNKRKTKFSFQKK